MKIRGLFCILSLALLYGASYQFLSTTSAQLTLSLCCVVMLLGVLFFDEKNQITSSNRHTVLFVLFSGILFLALNEGVKERFFLDIGGALLLINLFFERESTPWRGNIFFRTPLIGTLLFSNLIITECIPALNPEAVLVFDLLALVFVATQELFIIKRANAVETAGSLTSCLHLILTGTAAYVYRQMFLPQIALTSDTFWGFGLALAILGLLLSLISFFQNEPEKKLIYFFAGWGLFLTWGALFQKNGGFTVVLGIIFSAWILISSRGRANQPFSKVFSFAGPGTLLFVPVLGILAPAGQDRVSLHSILWALFFVSSWLGISSQKTESPDARAVSWKQGLLAVFTAVSLLIMGAGINIDFIKERF